MVYIRVGTWNLASHLASNQRNQVLRHGSTLEPVPSCCKVDLCPENYIHKPQMTPGYHLRVNIIWL